MIPLQTEVMLAVKDAAKAYNKNEDQIWEQRRYEIAKALLPKLYSTYGGTVRWQCERAVTYADELIKVLKGEKYDNTQAY